MGRRGIDLNIQEINVTKQEALNVLLEEIYLYLRYGEIEKAFDVLDEAINENKNHYEYLVEKVKLLYMLYLKEEAYEVLDANIELLYNNIDKIDVDFISRRIYYHFYRNTELDATNNTTGNFDYLKITKEFISKYGLKEQSEHPLFLSETVEPESADINTTEGEKLEEYFSSNDNGELFCESTIMEEVLDELEVQRSDEVVEFFEPVVDEMNIFEDSLTESLAPVDEVVDDKEIDTEEILETVVEEFADEITEDEKFEPEIIDDTLEDKELGPEVIDNVTEEEKIEPEIIDDTTLELEEQKIFSEFIMEESAPILEKTDEADTENESLEKQDADEILSTEDISAEEVITEQTHQEEEDIVIEDNPDIDVPIYLGRVNGNDVFLESMAGHAAPAKKETPIIIIDSAQYTFARLASLLVLGFVIGAAIVYYL